MLAPTAAFVMLALLGPGTSALRVEMGLIDRLFQRVPAAAPSPPLRKIPSSASRESLFPEQYPAVKDRAALPVRGDSSDVAAIRPFLAATQLEYRPLQLVYKASRDGWRARDFHERCDGKGAAVVVVKAAGKTFGAYNPKGWAGLGENRPSVAAFLFAGEKSSLTKLRKLGGGGLAVCKDDKNNGICFGPDSLIIPLDGSKTARSKLGAYYECLPDGSKSLFGSSNEVSLSELLIYVGKYGPNEVIPYSGGVFDMTSG